jgi:uncharacterized protein (DUF169 family)
MTDANDLVELLNLAKQPVAIKFQDNVPAGIPRIDQAALSGCTYWKYASQGRTFYTTASDHYGCPVGPEKAKELESLVGTMVDLKYLDPREVPQIPHRSAPFAFAVYAPLVTADFEPDAILVAGNARQIMLLAEAAQAGGVACDSSMVGRPTCAAIPAVMQTQRTATNLGCIGNRVYTGLSDDELYFAISGSQLRTIVEKLAEIVRANQELEKFHRGRVA